MTYLWGEDGITKKITYKGISMPSQKEDDKTEPTENPN